MDEVVQKENNDRERELVLREIDIIKIECQENGIPEPSFEEIEAVAIRRVKEDK